MKRSYQFVCFKCKTNDFFCQLPSDSLLTDISAVHLVAVFFIFISLVSRSTNDGAQFFCQHGPAECDGNRMQSCVLQQTTDQETQVKFSVCQMTANYKSSIQYCADSVGLSADINECMSSQLGTLLQLDAEKITQLYAPTFVPTIVYDGKFDQHLQDSSLSNFKGVVCSLLQARGSIVFNSVC